MANPIITALMEQQILSLWGKGDLSLVDRNYAPDVIDHMPMPGQPQGRAALVDVVADFRQMIPDLEMVLHGTLACSDMGVDFWTLTGTHAATSRPIAMSGIDMVRVVDGQIAEMWHVEEMLQFGDQIGTAPTAFGAPLVALPTSGPSDATDPGRHARVPDPASLSDREARNLALGRDHIEQIWALGDMAAAYRLYAPEVIDHNPAPGQRPGIDGIVDVLGWLREAVPDLTMTIEHYVVDGDFVADRWIMHGTHTGVPLLGVSAAGRRFTINGMDVVRFRDDGLITDVWHVEEFASLRAQISG